MLTPRSGIARYTYEVSKGMKSISSDIEWYYYQGTISRELIDYHSQNGNSHIGLRHKVKNIVSSNRYTKALARKTLEILSKLQKDSYDLYWESNFIPEPSINSKKSIITIHDFSFHLYREWHPKERVDYFSKYFFERIDRADHIITVSEYIKSEAVGILNIADSDISVIHNGVDHSVYREYNSFELEKSIQKFGINSPFILFVGSIEPRKNLLRLIKAYIFLPKELKERFQLLLVGTQGWNNSKIMDMIESENGNIRYIGSVDDIELAHLYNLAEVFVYPSLYEGFGIPPVEAMACGTPVIVSNISSLPEVCGDSALYIDPYSIESISEALYKILSDTNLRDDLTNRGIVQAKKYSWQKTSKEHLELFSKFI